MTITPEQIQCKLAEIDSKVRFQELRESIARAQRILAVKLGDGQAEAHSRQQLHALLDQRLDDETHAVQWLDKVQGGGA